MNLLYYIQKLQSIIRHLLSQIIRKIGDFTSGSTQNQLLDFQADNLIFEVCKQSKLQLQIKPNRKMIANPLRTVLKLKINYLFSVEAVQSLSPLKIKLIKQSLPHVHKYGWSENAILAACTQLDLSAAAHRIIRPFDMIAYCMKNWNHRALRKIDDTNFEGKTKIREKVHFAIQQRLTQQLEYIDTWNQAMAIGAHPTNINQTKNILWEYSDEVWRRCGDTSTDYNYYSKRILFNSAYATTELHLLTDQSPYKNESWKFLERRIEDILQIGKGVNDIKTVGGAAVDGLLNLVSMFREPPARQIKNPIYEHKADSVSNQSPKVGNETMGKTGNQNEKSNS